MLVLVRCHSPAAPIVFLDLQLDSLWVEPSSSALVDSGLVVVMGQPTDTSSRLGANERLRLEVTTSGGDTEELSFASYICPHATECSSLSVSMKDGHDVRLLTPIVYAVPGRLYSVSASGRTGGIRVFDPRNASKAISRIAREATVSTVSLSGLSFPDFIPTPYSQALAAIGIQMAPPIVRDGLLQLASGEIITFRYIQPDETTATVSISVP
jgi:hypothetical protein